MTSTTAPAFTHTNDCDRKAIGRELTDLIAGIRMTSTDEQLRHVDFRPQIDILEHIVEMSAAHPRVCDCGQLALSRVENSLRLARKALRAKLDTGAHGVTVETMQARVWALRDERDAIRAAVQA